MYLYYTPTQCNHGEDQHGGRVAAERPDDARDAEAGGVVEPRRMITVLGASGPAGSPLPPAAAGGSTPSRGMGYGRAGSVPLQMPMTSRSAASSLQNCGPPVYAVPFSLSALGE